MHMQNHMEAFQKSVNLKTPGKFTKYFSGSIRFDGV